MTNTHKWPLEEIDRAIDGALSAGRCEIAAVGGAELQRAFRYAIHRRIRERSLSGQLSVKGITDKDGALIALAVMRRGHGVRIITEPTAPTEGGIE